jgi:hypothetical protein
MNGGLSDYGHPAERSNALARIIRWVGSASCRLKRQLVGEPLMRVGATA